MAGYSSHSILLHASNILMLLLTQVEQLRLYKHYEPSGPLVFITPGLPATIYRQTARVYAQQRSTCNTFIIPLEGQSAVVLICMRPPLTENIPWKQNAVGPWNTTTYTWLCSKHTAYGKMADVFQKKVFNTFSKIYNLWLLKTFSFKYVPSRLTNNRWALVQVMFWLSLLLPGWPKHYRLHEYHLNLYFVMIWADHVPMGFYYLLQFGTNHHKPGLQLDQQVII